MADPLSKSFENLTRADKIKIQADQQRADIDAAQEKGLFGMNKDVEETLGASISDLFQRDIANDLLSAQIETAPFTGIKPSLTEADKAALGSDVVAKFLEGRAIGRKRGRDILTDANRKKELRLGDLQDEAAFPQG